MATITAIANGNWNDASTWDLNRVPAVDDDVLLDNHTITIANNIHEVKSISNGILTSTASAVHNGSFTATESINYVFFNFGSNDTIINYTLTCQEIKISSKLLSTRGTGGTVRIYGNINVFAYCNILEHGIGRTQNIVINGNVINKSTTSTNFYLQNTTGGTTTINGNLDSISSRQPITINGALLSKFEPLSFATLNINGNIYYTDNSMGVKNFGFTATSIGFANLQLWQNLSDPSIYSFRIITDYQLNNRQQYPHENEVKQGTEYAWGEKVGTYTPDYPPESVVLKDYEYGDSDDPKTGTMVQEVNVEVGCVTPEDVRKDVPLVGMGVVGTLVVPSVDDVREGVIFDNGSVGTLIVQGGGDRLRIADFGYYTNAQSDTYIVDLTEQDKPKFAVAEERVLIEMFPDLDLDNIPEKYFDDLFVKYLKYRLIVEYYRTAGINSTFTPSEPTTEIVNYQNVRNEVWLNSANIYLKAWSKKFPESITKPQRILL